MKKIYLPLFVIFFISGHLALSQNNCEFDSYINYGNYGSNEICPGTEVDFYMYYYDTDSIFWDFDNGTTRTGKYPYNIIFETVGTYVYNVTIFNSCGADTTLSDTIFVRNDIEYGPNEYISYDISPAKACPSEEVRFDVWGNNFTSVTWDVGDGTTTHDDYYYHNYSSTGTFPIALTLTNGCGNDTTVYDTVIVDSNITFTDETYLRYEIYDRVNCPGDEVRFDTWGEFETAVWDLGDGTVIQDDYFRHTYTDTGTYPIILTLTNACGNDTVIYDTVNVINNLHYTGNISMSIYPDELCPGDKTRFSSYADAVTYEWNISDGTTSDIKRFKHAFDSAGTYDVQLTLTNGCGIDTTIQDQVIVNSNITFGVLDYEISEKEVCPEQQVRFSSRDYASTYIWTFGDGDISTAKYTSHSFSGEQEKYPVSLTVANGCGNFKTVWDTITINNDIRVGEVEFMISPTKVCPNQQVLFIIDQEKVNQVRWNFGDGATSDKILAFHSYDLIGNYNATIQATNGCGYDTIISQTVRVQDNVESSLKDFEYGSSVNEACIGDTVAFYIAPVSDGTEITWDFGDGNSSSTPEELELSIEGIDYVYYIFEHAYSENGTFKTTITLTNGCGKTASDTIDIYIHDNAQIEYVNLNFEESQIEVNKPIQFIGNGGSTSIIDFGDGTIDTVYNPLIITEHTYTSGGTYNISITASNHCGNIKSNEETIEIFDPDENVTRIDANICEGDTFNYDGNKYTKQGHYDFIYSPDSIVFLNINVHPHWNVIADTTFCEGSFFNIGGTNYSTPGTQATDSTLKSMYGCDSIVTYNLSYDTSAYEEQICLVTIDSVTGKNLVTWEKTPDQKITGYTLYRENNTQGYDSIAYLPFDSLSVFVDTGSDPESHQELYKLVTHDECGNVTDINLVPYHKTLFLQYVSSVGGVNLEWRPYTINGVAQTFESYIIYRGADSNSLQPLVTVSGSLDAYTDNSAGALSGRKYYRIAGVKSDPCYPNGNLKASGGPFSRSVSNLEDNRLKSDNIEENTTNPVQLSVFPNPSNGKVKIQYTLQKTEDISIDLYSVLGNKIDNIVNEKQELGVYIQDYELPSGGTYFVKCHVNGVVITKKIICLD